MYPFFIVSLFALYFSAPFVNNQGSSIVRGPYISSVTQNSAIIAWTTERQARSSVQYGLSLHYSMSYKNDAASNIHTFNLEGLVSNRRYHYRAISESDTTSDFTFWTAPAKADTFSFVAYGDTRSNHEAHVRVLREIFKTAPRFILNTGDLVSRNTVSNWDEYFVDICDSTRVGQTIPIYSSPGNHDAGEMYYENLFLPHNNPWKTMEYYSFDWGSVYVVSLNTETDYKQESEQYRWVLQDLESPTAKSAVFKIAFWHRPPYSSGTGHGSDMTVRSVLGALMESHGVDIVFSGHDHTYERTIPMNGTTYVVTGGGGAPLYGFKNNNEWTAYKEKTYHFCKLMVEGKVLRISMIRDDGSVGDSFVVDKNTAQPARIQKK